MGLMKFTYHRVSSEIIRVFSNSCSVCLSFKSRNIFSKSYQFPPISKTASRKPFTYIYILANQPNKQTNKLYCIISSQKSAAEFSKMSVNDVESLPASRKFITILKY
jgi:hypothetical protein